MPVGALDFNKQKYAFHYPEWRNMEYIFSNITASLLEIFSSVFHSSYYDLLIPSLFPHSKEQVFSKGLFEEILDAFLKIFMDAFASIRFFVARPPSSSIKDDLVRKVKYLSSNNVSLLSQLTHLTGTLRDRDRNFCDQENLLNQKEKEIQRLRKKVSDLEFELQEKSHHRNRV